MNNTLPKTSEYLDMELLSKLPSLEVRAKFLVSGFLAGLHKSPYRGSSVEFKEYREYQLGDSLKLIDWKAYAKSDRLHVRLREEETNMIAYLMLDVSKSMDYKSPKANMTKWEFAQSLAAAFLLFLNKQSDACSLSFIGGQLTDFIKGSSKQSHFHQMMVNLHRNADEKESNICDALLEISEKIRQRSMVIVFSDFYSDIEQLKDVISRLKYMKAEVLFFHILDPMEIDFSFDESVLLQELESDEEMILSPDLIRDEYKKVMQEHIENVSNTIKSFGGDFVQLRTDTSPLEALGIYLAKRGVMS